MRAGAERRDPCTGYRTSEGSSLVGLHYEHVRDGHPLCGGHTSAPVRLVACDRRDATFIRMRGGASDGLEGRRVAVIGCGALGGHVTVQLASMGIGSIDLVDPERLKSENVFRHVLGMSALDQPKAAALCAHISKTFPYIKVRAVTETAERAQEQRQLDWANYDAVIVTIGDVTGSRRLNAQLAASRTPTVFTWIEPLGIGGHALASRFQAGAGCYDCLFIDADGDECLTSTRDFAAANQVFARDLTGCASGFTPYAQLDAIRTAELATRLTVKAIQGPFAGRLESWRGDPAAFLSHYRLSDRWNLPPDQEPLAHSKCRVCGRPS